MECLYLPEENFSIRQNVTVTDEEFRHIKALHLRENSLFAISNGVGGIATAKITAISKREAEAEITGIKIIEKPKISLSLALGILDNRERFEFALEKAVELGATDFIPLASHYAQRNSTNTERLKNKAIAALKQSIHPYVINIHEPTAISDLLKNENSAFYLADEDAESPLKLSTSLKNIVLVVGPEGGFSTEEIKLIKSNSASSTFKMGDFRLRAETAAIVGLSQINYLLSIG